MWLSWSLTVLLAALVIWLLPASRKAVLVALQPISLWQAFWPVAVGISLSGIVWFKGTGKKWLPVPGIPQGDLLFAFRYLYHLVFKFSSLLAQRIRQSLPSGLKFLEHRRPQLQAMRKLPAWLEKRLLDWQTAGLIFVLLTGCLFAWSLN
jgi:hypothetical protein